MASRVLITGGGGFIGSALARRLVAEGGAVAVLDSLHPQVHSGQGRPAGLPDEVQLITGDVAHEPDWDAALKLIRPEVIVHLAAETGTAQSLTHATRHGRVNVVGTTAMLDTFTKHELVPRHIILASSRAVYGEGAWESDGVVFYPGQRTHTDLAAQRWDPVGPGGRPAQYLPSRADSTQTNPTSVYAATKLAQEHIISAWSAATGTKVSILRLQNVYGPGQSLTNPYTGIVSLFGRVGAAGGTIDVYEDGQIVRDLVFIDDVVNALSAAITQPPDGGRLLDIGSGRPTTIASVAETVATLTSAPQPKISGRFRDGDVRCAACDTDRAAAELSLPPTVELRTGIQLLLEWIGQQHQTVISQ
jgi:dTDP-L-rhamnose 4-epimerase